MTQGTMLFIMRQVMEYTYYLLVGLTWRIALYWSKHDPIDNLQCECPLISVTFVYYITITTTYVYLSFLISLKSQGEFLVTIPIAYTSMHNYLWVFCMNIIYVFVMPNICQCFTAIKNRDPTPSSSNQRTIWQINTSRDRDVGHSALSQTCLSAIITFNVTR